MINQNAAEAVDVNSRQSIIAAIYLSIVGAAVFIVQPGFVQGMVEFNGFTEQQAGYIASTEMWGIAIMTIGLVFISSKFSWRSMLMLGALMMTAGNLLSAFTTDYELFAALRLLTGLGAGFLVSLTFTIIGLTSNPDRNFGYMIMWILVYGAIGFSLMPFAYQLVGFKGTLVFFAVFSLSSIPLIGYLPVQGASYAAGDEDAVELSTPFKSLAVLAMFVYFLAQGVVWAYLFLIGLSSGVDEQGVSFGLTASQFTGVVGALLAAIVANRFGRVSPLACGIGASVVSLAFMFGSLTATVYAAAVCLFNFAWNMTHPYLLAAMASFDKTGKVVVYAVAGQMLGLAIGPALAASVLGDGDYAIIIKLGMVLFSLSFLIVVVPIVRAQRSH